MQPLRGFAGALALVVLLGSWPCYGQDDARETLVRKCTEDLAERAEVAGAAIEVALVEGVTWRDGSLGCPEPGMDYTMALVPGFRVVLRAGGRNYEYHTDTRDRIVLCDRPFDPSQTAAGAGPDGTVVGGGVRTPTPEPVVLYLVPNPQDVNLNGRLLATYLAEPGEAPAVVLESCSDFVVSDTGWILAKRRTSRSGHELVLLEPGQQPRVVSKAFDFGAMAFVPGSASYLVLVRRAAGDEFRFYGADTGRPPALLDWAPAVRPGAPAALAIWQGVAVVTIPGREDTEQGEAIVLDLLGQKTVAQLRATKAVGSVLPRQ